MVVAVAVVCHSGWWLQPVEKNRNPWSQVGSSQDFDNVKMALESQPHQSPPCGLHSPPLFVGSLYDLYDNLN